MEVVQITYEPNERQVLFHTCPAEEAVYGGAKGGGKTCALVMECAAYALEHPGCVCYLFRESYDDLEANLISTWKQWIPKELYDYSETKRRAVLKNGSEVYFRHIAVQTDADAYQGRSIDWIGVDELTKHTLDSIQTLLSCLRSPKGFPPRFRGSCNPGDIGHKWVKERYILPTNYGQKMVTDETTGNRLAFIPAKVYDNVALMTNDPAYVRRLQHLPEARRKAYLEGDWDSFEGQYFEEWDAAVHVVKPFPIPQWWQRFRSLDYGLDMTACLWWAVDDSGNEYIYRELHEPGLSLSRAARRILDLSKEGGEEELIRYTVASPDLWNRQQQSDSGYSGEELMAEAGLVGLIKADNRRVAGWRAVREHLKVVTVEVADGVTERRAKLHVFDDLMNFKRCVPALVHDEYNPEDVSDKDHEITHLPDALRYGVMSRPSLGVSEEEVGRRRKIAEAKPIRFPGTGM